ncbi:hypothetical protein [Erwinia sp.]|uniref:hypothetical protein n=1 Tax=Erwinia citreus TaxID=558 RepID=UPI00289FDD79|nr:hypothetical protein [Erwinia sp.]
MEKIPFNKDKILAGSPISYAIQQHLIVMIQQQCLQIQPANFSGFFGSGLQLIDDFKEISTLLNPYQLNTNCYYCTVAALTNQTVNELVAESETMQQYGGTLAETLSLYGDAGRYAALTNFDAPTLPTNVLWEQTYDYIDRELAATEAMGLTYFRHPHAQRGGFPLGSGHAVVVAKDMYGTIAILDYQVGSITTLSKKDPPEGQYQKSYHLFQQYALHATNSWREAYTFITRQFNNHTSWKGILATEDNLNKAFIFYFMSDENSMWIELDGEKVKLNLEEDIRTNGERNLLLICPLK